MRISCCVSCYAGVVGLLLKNLALKFDYVLYLDIILAKNQILNFEPLD